MEEARVGFQGPGVYRRSIVGDVTYKQLIIHKTLFSEVAEANPS